MISFTRKISISALRYKDLSKIVNVNGKITELKGTPNLYNPKSSASNYRGVLRAKIDPGTYYYPSQSSSTGSINSETFPSAFLPKDDPRKQILTDLRANDKVQSQLAPELHNKGEKTYHLEPKDITEIIALRKQDPEKYTRKVLAKKYGVSPLFISLVSSASEERKNEMSRRLNEIQQRWHAKRKVAREDRKKRKELWYRA
ncbi:LAFE_0F01310g1_1 [Lachancea fermentati]|uniref:LAFE_0F01310g1_1 n=1 Tax=Lachancea fermentati TaxID=4955 RepID=A0A1G4MEC2_LACFM|nr:LAFE_0F01310g1_1 [Lachancea fermentati]